MLALFIPLLLSLHATTVAVLLPSVIPQVGDGSATATAVVSKDRYVVEVAFTPGCHYSTVCRIGEIIGERAAEPRSGDLVKLRDGTRARYEAATCGANCGDATLSWERGAFRYTVAVKAGSLKDVEVWANSMEPVSARGLGTSGVSPPSPSTVKSARVAADMDAR